MRLRYSIGILAAALAIAFVGCGSTEEPARDDDGTGPGDGGDDGGGDAGSDDAGGESGAPDKKCEAPTSGPTYHDTSFDEDQTWTADASPHIVTWNTYVLEGATLTIEPCAEILIDEGMSLGSRDGLFLAEGTAQRPIRIAGLDGAAWTKLEFDAPSTARLAYVDIEGGGNGGSNDTYGTSVEVWGDDTFPADPILFVDHVTVRGSAGVGVSLRGMGSFLDGSRDLVVTECGGIDWPYPLVLEEHSIDSLPTGTYTGNRKDEFFLRLVGAGTAGDGLKVDATLHERGIPYRLEGGFNVAANEDGKVATLTIEPGVTIKLAAGKSFQVEHWTGESPATGVLRALGTADNPVVFTSAADELAPGDWQGLWFGGVPSADNLLDHVVIEYAGADCGCSVASCNDLADSDGAVLISNYPGTGAAFITNSTIRHIAGHGIVEGWAFSDGDARNAQIDFTPTNTFDVTGCVQTLPGNLTAGGCPSPRPTCE